MRHGPQSGLIIGWSLPQSLYHAYPSMTHKQGCVGHPVCSTDYKVEGYVSISPLESCLVIREDQLSLLVGVFTIVINIIWDLRELLPCWCGEVKAFLLNSEFSLLGNSWPTDKTCAQFPCHAFFSRVFFRISDPVTNMNSWKKIGSLFIVSVILCLADKFHFKVIF